MYIFVHYMQGEIQMYKFPLIFFNFKIQEVNSTAKFSNDKQTKMKMYLKIHVKSKADELNAMWAVYYYLKNQ